MPSSRKKPPDQAALLLPRPERRALRPLGDDLPIGIVLAGELPPAGMEGVAAALRSQRMGQDFGGQRIVHRLDDLCNRADILARLFIRPAWLPLLNLFPPPPSFTSSLR